jgi:hypothetical protein
MPADPVHPDQLDGQARFRADLVAYLERLPIGELAELLGKQERKDTKMELRLAEVLAWVRGFLGVRVMPYLQLRLPDLGRPRYIEELDKLLDVVEPSPEELKRARDLRARIERHPRE